MRAAILLSSALLVPPALIAQNAAAPRTLAAMHDRFRPLLIFAGSPEDPALLAQVHMLKDSAPGLEDRDVLVVAVPYRAPAVDGVSLAEREAEAARRRFHVAHGEFVVILLGKDGEEKLRSAKPVSFAKLKLTIDAMPMRQDEMREKRWRGQGALVRGQRASPPVA